VVVLLDEYDKPILDFTTQPEKAKEVRFILPDAVLLGMAIDDERRGITEYKSSFCGIQEKGLKLK
jgi:hypothetical protein